MVLLKLFKALAKKNRFLLLVYEKVFQRPIVNYFKSNNRKRALFSYSTYHFKKEKYKAHSNYQESIVMAEILHQMDYRVDVINNNRFTNVNLHDYDVIIGEGIPMYQAITEDVESKKIYYATGSHPWQCTQASLNRLSAFAKKYHHVPFKSTRIQDFRWGVAASCADHVICIGNLQTKQTFIDNGVSSIYLIKPSFHQGFNQYLRSIDNIKVARKTALWFGSYGLLHKGLDITVEAFRNNPDWTLYVCGYTEAEQEFIRCLDVPNNVIIEGFLNVDSERFRYIADKCLYVILPSCSEGIATSVITAMGRGAMIPIVTRECGVDINEFGVLIDSVTAEAVDKALSLCDRISDESLSCMSRMAFNSANSEYTLDKYKNNMIVLLHDLTRRTHV